MSSTTPIVINIVGKNSLALTPSTLLPATLGSPYSQSIQAHLGYPPYTYIVSAGTLPIGLSLNTSTGLLSGTPNEDGTFHFTVSATDQYAQKGSINYTLVVSGPLNISPEYLQSAELNTLYTATIDASGGVFPYTYSVTDGVLPTGLDLNPATGSLSGTPTTTGSYPFTITASDLLGTRGSHVYAIVVSGQLNVSPSTLPSGLLNVAYSQTVRASAGVPPYTYAITAGYLPYGLTLNTSTGVISGVPSVIDTFYFTVTATDKNGATGSRGYAFLVSGAIPITPSTLNTASLNTPYSATLQAHNGVPPYTYQVSAGALPIGLTLNSSTGVISGTPTVLDNNIFAITVTDSTLATGSQAYALLVTGDLPLTPSTLPNGLIGSLYNATITANNGIPPYVYSVSAGSLPAGLSLNSTTGAISGTPEVVDNYSFTITATDATNDSGSRNYSLIIGGTITISPPSPLSTATLNKSYSQQFSGNNGVPPYTFTASQSSLPPGLTLSSTGLLSGIPTVDDTYIFTVTITDAKNATGTANYTLVTSGPLPLSPPPPSLPSGTLGMLYTPITISASGGTPPYTYGYSGNFPEGLTLDPNTGIISGIPVAIDTYNFTINATDAHSIQGSALYTLLITGDIFLTPSNSALPTAQINTAYSQTIVAHDGIEPYTYSLQTGYLPTGLSLNPSTGVISGTTSDHDGTYPVTVQATDSYGNQGARNYQLVVSGNLDFSNPPGSSLTTATLGGQYNYTLIASGGKPPYKYSISSNTLPPGLKLANSSTGVISGRPTTVGTYTFTISASDSNTPALTGSRLVSLVVTQLSITPSSSTPPYVLPRAYGGIAYSQQISANNCVGGCTYAISAGTLPPGLTICQSTASGCTPGLISGVPTTSDNYPFSVTATDTLGEQGVAAYSLSVDNPEITISPFPLASATLNEPYTQQLTAAGGGGSYTYVVISGSLPTGLSLNQATGLITGTPTDNSSFTFTIQATDQYNATGSQPYTILVSGSLRMTPPPLPTATVNIPYTTTIKANNGNGNYTYTVTPGYSLPSGLSLSTTGVLSGTPTVIGTFPIAITATDTSGATGSQAYTFLVSNTLTFLPTSSTLTSGVLGNVYSQAISAGNGTPPYTYKITYGNLPAGLSLCQSTGSSCTPGVISGIPTVVSSNTFTITATDSVGGIGLMSYTLPITNLTLSPSSPNLVPASLLTTYSNVITVNNGVPPYTFNWNPSALPPGISLTPVTNPSTGLVSSALLSGTPTTDGIYTFTITAAEQSPNTGTALATYTLNVSGKLPISPVPLPDGTVGTTYGPVQLSTTGGNGHYTFSLASNSILPYGLTLSPSGVISGTPQSSGSYTFYINVTDTTIPTPNTGTQQYTVSVNGNILLTPTNSLLATIIHNQPMPITTITATYGEPPYAFSYTGSLPTGISFTPDANAGTASLSGTTTSNNDTYTINVNVVGSHGTIGTRTYDIVVTGTLSFTSPSGKYLPSALQNDAYSYTVQASGGTAPYSYLITNGSLPPGLELTSTGPQAGTVSGTPTANGTYTFTISTADSSNPQLTGSNQFQLSVGNPMTFDPTSTSIPTVLPQGILGQTSYSQQITATPCAGCIYTYTGTLPPGLTLSSSGLISGSLANSTSDQYTFVVNASNGVVTGTQTYEIDVYLPASSCKYIREAARILDCYGNDFCLLLPGQGPSCSEDSPNLWAQFSTTPNQPIICHQSPNPQKLVGESEGCCTHLVNTEFESTFINISGSASGCSVSLCNQSSCTGVKTAPVPLSD